MITELCDEDIDALATGAWILGTGGGGNPYLAQLGLKRLYKAGKRCRIIQPEALADDQAVGVVSMMGAPLVLLERFVNPEDLVRAVRLLEETRNCQFSALMAIEIGGGNGIAPMLAAALMDLPVVDADAMGRAFPEATNSSFAIGDLTMYPMSLVDSRGVEAIVAKTPNWHWLERASRAVCAEFGSIAATCKAPRTGAEVKRWGVLHTVTQAINIGRAVLDARRGHSDPVAALLKQQGGKLLFRGKVTDVDRTTGGGFLRGMCKLSGVDDHRGQQIEMAFQNEWIAVYQDGAPIASTPELICLLDTESGESIGTETVRYGQRVSVAVLPAPAHLTTPRGLAHVGPRAFGHDFDFRSVFSS
ncbi:DUF917 domain-containing protein [Paracoccus sp. (in: a-proteobacteria)]|uniref:DUF917 domain-containing protein n=1 Tax=Paracoccus sp. TaxID=267 RepID=UPI003A84FA0D